MLAKSVRAALLALPLLIVACSGSSSADEAQKGKADAKASSNSVLESNDMILGSADAPVTVIEYASVTCPHCADFAENVMPEIKKEFIDTGKVKWVFREFPTPPQGLSYAGSVLARCAAEKGGTPAFFLIVDTLFRTQRTWVLGKDPKLELEKIAAQAGMDDKAFEACIQRQDLVDVVNDNVKKGSERYGIDSTPSFVVNGEKQQIPHTVEDFQKALSEAVAKATGTVTLEDPSKTSDQPSE